MPYFKITLTVSGWHEVSSRLWEFEEMVLQKQEIEIRNCKDISMKILSHKKAELRAYYWVEDAHDIPLVQVLLD